MKKISEEFYLPASILEARGLVPCRITLIFFVVCVRVFVCV